VIVSESAGVETVCGSCRAALKTVLPHFRMQLQTKSCELTYPVNNLDALREKRKCVIAQVVQIIDRGRLLLFICTESAEEPF
jgi:hypothetical protein